MRRFPVLAAVCLAVLPFTSPHAQELIVKSATAKAVELQWTAAASAQLERASGPDFQKVAAAEAGHYQDTGIDPFATYRYRLNAAGKFSNIVTVGPPPAGISNAAKVPKGTDPPNYGPATAVALDENGDPVIAFEWIDPNADGDKSDTEIRFVRWDRAAYKWAAPVQVAKTGPLGDQAVNPIALGCDRASGTLAILAAVDENLLYATSTDHGATWKAASLPSSNATPHAVSLMVSGDQVSAAINAESGATFATGPLADASKWKSQPIPAGAGWKLRNNANIPLASDAAGKPALAFYEDQEEGDGHRYAFWRPGDSQPALIFSTAGVDTPDTDLAYAGNNFLTLFAGLLDDKDTDHTILFSRSQDGKSWSKPSKLPIDGPRTTNPPLAIAGGSKGEVTAAFGSNGGSAGAKCGAPTVSRSADGSSWTTCGLGKAAGAEFGPQPATIHVIEPPNDKAYVVWQEPGDTKYAPGVLVWHER